MHTVGTIHESAIKRDALLHCSLRHHPEQGSIARSLHLTHGMDAHVKVQYAVPTWRWSVSGDPETPVIQRIKINVSTETVYQRKTLQQLATCSTEQTEGLKP